MKTMKDFKGSKGNWIWQSFSKLGDPFFIDDVSKNREIATVHSAAGKDEPVPDNETSYAEAEANAKLMANSKNVLKALIASVNELDEAKRHWEAEADSFDHPAQEQERRLSLDRVNDLKSLIRQAEKAINDSL